MSLIGLVLIFSFERIHSEYKSQMEEYKKGNGMGFILFGITLATVWWLGFLFFVGFYDEQDVSRYLENMNEAKDKYYSLPAIGGTTTSAAFRPTQYEKEIM